MRVLEKLLEHLPAGWTVTSIDIGQNWMLVQTQHKDGTVGAGVATAPHVFADDAAYAIGSYSLKSDARQIVQLIKSTDPSEAAVGLATLNAIQALSDNDLSPADAADWLAEQSNGKHIAIFGRFPFIEDEIRPFAKQVFVFEQTPKAGEYSANDMPHILPQADIVAITGTTIINHTFDEIVKHTHPDQIGVVLGPSTPLTPRLFDFGIDALFGVRVADVDAVRASVRDHLGFQKVLGLSRVALFKS